MCPTDRILIGTPMYNFSVPAVLKSWIDYIVRPGFTFSPGREPGRRGARRPCREVRGVRRQCRKKLMRWIRGHDGFGVFGARRQSSILPPAAQTDPGAPPGVGPSSYQRLSIGSSRRPQTAMSEQVAVYQKAM
ncbi:NAD(P)H-dependent oxidoreductase [Lichenicola sp.]|uniref:NAD(P)H-dependent oxidoreductase n=1 Tax=Lichenicola sp. TaxID=2804529 RepID=UPI003AFFB799